MPPCVGVPSRLLGPRFAKPSVRLSGQARFVQFDGAQEYHVRDDDEDGQTRPLLSDVSPDTPPPTRGQVQTLVEFLTQHRNVTVITGAGMSTESSIPDYRSAKGAYSSGFKPMTHQQFMLGPENRRRYWARSFVGWQEFAHAEPNDGHHALTELQRRAFVTSILTQNVDRLHQRAGSRHVIEMHGTTHEVICLDCGHLQDRHSFQDNLRSLNPAALAYVEANTRPARVRAGTAADARAMVSGNKIRSNGHDNSSSSGIGGGGDRKDIRPDGDVELGEKSSLYNGFQVPPCRSCQKGILKPNVVFFGDNMPSERKHAAAKAVDDADAVLVLGSSLMVYSAFRLIRAAKGAAKPVGCVTVGETRADDLLDFKIETRVGELLARVSRDPALIRT